VRRPAALASRQCKRSVSHPRATACCKSRHSVHQCSVAQSRGCSLPHSPHRVTQQAEIESLRA
jgi:hypothetical protein